MSLDWGRTIYANHFSAAAAGLLLTDDNWMGNVLFLGVRSQHWLAVSGTKKGGSDSARGQSGGQRVINRR